MSSSLSRRFLRLLSEHGLILALVLLCGFFSWATLAEQYTGGAAGGEALAQTILKQHGKGVKVAIVAGTAREEGPFVESLAASLQEGGAAVVGKVQGHPSDARKLLVQLAKKGPPDVIAASHRAGRWMLLEDLARKVPALSDVEVISPRSYRWPNFLKTDNLLNIANQIAVIAILAVGMTVVIITGGIDLSVGSLIALSAVTAALLIRDHAGAEHATATGMVLCCLAAIGLCALVGLFNGSVITLFDVPPFLVTLAVMLMASGLAFIIAEGESIYQLPDSFVWLGRGADLLNLPNAVVLMLLLYLAAHVVMTRMTIGRYLYAVGGNAEAARLSGAPVKRVLILAYVCSGALAGLGGVVMASLFKSGSPTYGGMYELFVIAAVVVGGASVSGGEGRITGTLVGVLLIAVIQNGMNLTGVTSHTQKVVLGAVILGAVLLDRIKRRSWSWPRWLSRQKGAPFFPAAPPAADRYPSGPLRR
jgi:ribose transport system permease protein